MLFGLCCRLFSFGGATLLFVLPLVGGVGGVVCGYDVCLVVTVDRALLFVGGDLGLVGFVRFGCWLVLDWFVYMWRFGGLLRCGYCLLWL